MNFLWIYLLVCFFFHFDNKQKRSRAKKFEDKKKKNLITSKAFSMRHSSLNLFASPKNNQNQDLVVFLRMKCFFDLRNSQFEIFLCHVNTTFSESVHSSFGTNTLNRKIEMSWKKETKCFVTLTSAPDAPGIISAIFRKLIPRVKFILRE